MGATNLLGIKDMCIPECRRLVEEKFQRKNGYEADCDVIYGDTDSVMVNFRVKDIGRAMELGQEAAAFVSKTFVKPIKLEFEKVGLEMPQDYCMLQEAAHLASNRAIIVYNFKLAWQDACTSVFGTTH